MFYTPETRDKSLLRHDPFKAIIAPRPIGWVTTMGKDGAINLAPYSFFNAVADRPPILVFSSVGVKDSLTFARETGEFVWNMPTWDLRNEMNATSATLPRGENEFLHAGLEMAPSNLVRPPRVAKAPVAMECKVTSIQELKDVEDKGTDYWIVLGQVVGVHIDPAYIADGVFKLAEVKPIARCGYLADYAVVEDLFQMGRPG
ncbi:MAG: flavin reductase family protein [Hyphomicrobiales bacterium]|nr:flavin reductase family protein [Hyphomicrobiales bacterium]